MNARTLAVVAVVLAGIAFLVFLVGISDRQESPPALSSSLYHADVGDDTRVCYLTVEGRVATGGSARTNLTTTRYNRYRLLGLDIRSGVIVAEVPLGDRLRDDPTPQIIDVVGDQLWMWDGGLMIRETEKLGVVADGERLRAANPDLAEVIPTEASFFRSSAWFDGMTFKGLDARHYEVCGPDWKVRPIEEELDARASSGTSWVTFGWHEGSGRARSDRLFFNADVDGDTWFALLSKEERSMLGRWSGEPTTASGEHWRRAYRAPCARRVKGRDLAGWDRFETELDPERLEELGDESFLLGGLLASPRTDAAWRLDEPRSGLVMSKPSIAKEATWTMTRLDRDGAVVWKAETGLAGLEAVIDARDFAVLGGFPDHDLFPKEPYELVLIDLADGSTRVFQPQTSELLAR